MDNNTTRRSTSTIRLGFIGTDMRVKQGRVERHPTKIRFSLARLLMEFYGDMSSEVKLRLQK